MSLTEYHPKEWDWKPISNFLSLKQLDEHYKLYKGYVTNTNLVIKKIDSIVKEKLFSSPEYGELKRRLGWEFDGMRMHELYFDNMAPNKAYPASSELAQKITKQWGGYAEWEEDFAATGKMRGIGWVCLYADMNGNLFNHWIAEHEIGHLPCASIILAMDVWEHAYTVDFTPTQRPDYIKSFLKIIDWAVVDKRFNHHNKINTTA